MLARADFRNLRSYRVKGGCTIMSQADKVTACTSAADDNHLGVESSTSKTQLDRARHRVHAWGNYHNYYAHRQEAVPDARLQLLNSDMFKGKRVLDLGCNAGKLTIEVVKHLGAKSALGLDIDPYLIQQAEEARQRELEDGTEVKFACINFMLPTYEFVPDAYDVILLLSITKWLHLHHGDEGLRTLFRRLAESLPSGGILIVEPQERENYARAVKKNRDLRPMYKCARAGLAGLTQQKLTSHSLGLSRCGHPSRKL